MSNLILKTKEKLAGLIKLVEASLSLAVKLTIGLAVLGLIAFAAHTLLNSETNDVTAGSVMITNMRGNSGGTGIILKSSQMESVVLTNSHVCSVAVNGGMVSSKNGQFAIVGYKKSNNHDLCLIKVRGDLKYRTKIANHPPISYYESAIVSGHPQLLPNVITSGHFSGRKVIPVVVSMRKCTEEDFKNMDLAFLCIFAGGIPIIHQYESTLVTATIMPGSSGSGVYNKDLELAGVVFAGTDGLGYAWTVPYEYMKDFLENEQHKLEYKTPKAEFSLLDFSKGLEGFDENSFSKLKEACQLFSESLDKDVCTAATSDLIWNK